MAWKRKGKKQVSKKLCVGIALAEEGIEEKENRIFTLFIKGILVFLLSMGGIGAFVTSVGTDYNGMVVQGVLFVFSMYCSFMLYNKKTENLGYVFLFVIMAGAGWKFHNYINSGFYAVCNDVSDIASTYFRTNAMRSFGEQVSNRYLSVTIAMCYVGAVAVILINIMISRHMNYVWPSIVLLFFQLIPMYLMQQPKMLYEVYVLVGLFAAFILRGMKGYSLSSDNKKYEWKKGRRLTVHYDFRTWKLLFLETALLVVVLLFSVQAVFPDRAVDDMQQKNSKLKQSTMDTAKNVSLLGVLGLFNFYSSTGGLTSGKLGGVNSIRLDYNTDLKVRLAPGNGNRVYLRSFIGKNYLPVVNRWERDETPSYQNQSKEYYALKKEYERNNKKSAKAMMEVENVAAEPGEYLPYYSKATGQDILPNQSCEYTYYPVTSSELSYEVKGEDALNWLSVPIGNEAAIRVFCEKAGLKGNREDVIRNLKSYFQKHYPYTYSPGATPSKVDFINYFLLENKRGYCAHFASAAVLVLRHFGIPARYVEGYAFDFEEMAEGKVLRDKNYHDYYNGYSKLGKTNVLEVDVTDADAHAWVEVYDKKKGWQPLEFTPTSSEKDSSKDSIWGAFLRILGGGEGTSQKTSDSDNSPKITIDKSTKTVAVGSASIVMAFLILLLVLRIGYSGVLWIRAKEQRKRANRNDRFIALYSLFVHKKMKKARHLEELSQAVNYREQLQLLQKYQLISPLSSEEEAKVVTVLNQAGFSKTMITKKQWELVEEKLQSKFK